MKDKIISGNEAVYDVVNKESTIEQDVMFFIQLYKRRIERLERLLDGKCDNLDEYKHILWNDTCAMTAFKDKSK